MEGGFTTLGIQRPQLQPHERRKNSGGPAFYIPGVAIKRQVETAKRKDWLQHKGDPLLQPTHPFREQASLVAAVVPDLGEFFRFPSTPGSPLPRRSTN